MSIIRQTSAAATELAPGAELYVEGQYLSKPAALLSGWACRLRVLADGRRQIFDFLLPGDLFGHCTALNTVASTSALTLTTARIASAGCLFEMAVEPKRFPGLVPRLGGGAGAAGRLPPQSRGAAWPADRV